MNGAKVRFAKKYRESLLRDYGHLYSRHFYEGDSRCFYCGEYRTCLDHVPALAVVDAVTPKTLRRMEIPIVLIPSCSDCNGRLGKKLLATVEKRLLYLYERLNEKYDREIKLWSREEIAEMSPMFQAMIEARKIKNRVLQERIMGIERRILDTSSHPIFKAKAKSNVS